MDDLRSFTGRKDYTCCAEWHLHRSGLMLAVYGKLVALTRMSEISQGEFYAAQEGLAYFFGVHVNSIYRVTRQLRCEGWLKVIGDEHTGGQEWLHRALKHNKKRFFVFTHEEWAAENPGECFEPTPQLWSGDGDPLGRMLGAASSGTRWYPSMLRSLRRSFPGCSDQQIVEEWKNYLAGLGSTLGTFDQWRSIQLRFLAEVKENR